MTKTIFLFTLFFVLNSYPVFSEEVSEPIIMAKATIEEEFQWLQAEAIVFSVSRREQKISETAAAVYVISHEEIRRSGVTSIPEALRLVPGIQVAKVNSNTWAVSTRGFNLRFANKLLVLIDGRTVYNPLFSGVFWNSNDTLLEDVERIEVIRGPGAAMWGANAVNGIINIITKEAEKTQGSLVTGGVGNEEKGFGAFRHGGKINDDVSYRGYVKYFNRDGYVSSSGGNSNDDWEALQGGFRIDGDAANMNSFTLQGDIYNGDAGAVNDINFPFAPFSSRVNVSEDFSGGNILGRWEKTFSDTSDMALQLYFDREDQKLVNTFENLTTTYDADFQHRFKLNDRQDITWGLGYRYLLTNYKNSTNIVFDPTSRDLNLYSAFVQDEISLVQDRLKLILGSKFEHNSFTGVEIQPNGRLLWTPHERHSAWAAISRAVRTPSRADSGLSAFYLESFPAGSLFPGAPPALAAVIGSKDFESEELIAYELGYRTKPADNISLDIATFFNDYDKLWTRERGTPFLQGTFASTHLVIPLTVANKAYGETYGVELSAQWQVLEWLRLQAAYTYLQVQIHTKSDSSDSDAESDERISPRNQFFLKSSMDLPMNFELDTFLRYTDTVPEWNIGSYVELDLRLGWNLTEDLELSLVGQNLLDKSHPEFRDAGFDIPITEIPRTVFGKVLLRF